MEKTKWAETLHEGSEVVKNLQLILDKEPEFFKVTEELIKHLAKTYADKYEANKNSIDTKQQLYHPDKGGIINMYQISRYLQRYTADNSFAKGENKNDLYKICHYALFDCVRQNKSGLTKNVDIVDK